MNLKKIVGDKQGKFNLLIVILILVGLIVLTLVVKSFIPEPTSGGGINRSSEIWGCSRH